jgi:CDP-diacylglycerol--serine O-phosphatidyltransferase
MAGMTLATYYWFRESPLYQSTLLADLPWPVMLRFIMVGLAFLMISQVRYAAVPLIGYRTFREILGTLIVVGTLVGVFVVPKTFFFPAMMAYVIWGVVRTVFTGLLDRLPAGDEMEDGVFADSDGMEGAGFPRGRRRRRRSGRPGGGTPGSSNVHEEHRE